MITVHRLCGLGYVCGIGVIIMPWRGRSVIRPWGSTG